MNEVEADLALLALPPPPRPPIKTGSNFELVWLFLQDNGISPGKCASVETCTLYRAYVDWQRRAYPDTPPVSPKSFAVRVKRMRLKKRKDHYGRGYYLVRRGIADMLLSWERNNPDPDGYRNEFPCALPAQDERHSLRTVMWQRRARLA